MIASIAVEDSGWEQIPALAELTQRAVDATLARVDVAHGDLETFFLFADDVTAADLNAKWRDQAHATNVLSFPAKKIALPEGELRPLGDVMLAFGIVAREAAEQGKTLPHHATHLIVHGLLHLLGYGHETDTDAAAMQGLEAQIVKGLGYPDPYERQ